MNDQSATPPSRSPASRARSLAARSREVLGLAAAVGLVTGFGVVAFAHIVHRLLDAVLAAPLWAAAAAPTVGLALAALAIRFLRGGGTATADEYLRAYHDPVRLVDPRPFPARILASIATLGAGGAMGLEGPSIYIGATAGSVATGRLRRFLSGSHAKVLIVAGAAAGVAAIFKAPATGAVFALEVPYRDDLGRKLLLPALVGSATGYLAFVAVDGTERLFPVSGNPAFDLRDLGGALLLGVLAGILARSFAWLLLGAKRVAAAVPVWLRVLAGGAMLAGLAVAASAVAGDPLTLGPGYDAMHWADGAGVGLATLLAMLLMRSAATTVTVGAGGAGGLFVPLVVAGDLLGRCVGTAVGAHNASLFTVVGIAAVLGAGYRVPLAAIMFVAETTGRPGFVVPALLAAVAADLLMGDHSVTTYQQRTPISGPAVTPSLAE